MIRLVLLLALIALLLPADVTRVFGGSAGAAADVPEGGGIDDVANVVMGAASDMAGFCERQPEVCDTGGNIVESLRAKAVYWSGELHAWLAAQEDGDEPRNEERP